MGVESGNCVREGEAPPSRKHPDKGEFRVGGALEKATGSAGTPTSPAQRGTEGAPPPKKLSRTTSTHHTHTHTKNKLKPKYVEQNNRTLHGA